MTTIETWPGTGPPVHGSPTGGPARYWFADELVLDADGVFWKCTAPGRPGTWEQISADSGASVPYPADAVDATVGTNDNPDSDVRAYDWVQFPDYNEHAVLAWGYAADDFPRAVLCVDEGFFFGNGAVDPYTDGACVVGLSSGSTQIRIGGNGAVVTCTSDGHLIFGSLGGAIQCRADMKFSDGNNIANLGPLLQSPDESWHRLKVANDGTLSTEPVV